MSLSGNLGFVPIQEVLRLLTRSGQQGAVEVTGGGLSGRVFVGRGGIDLATTWSDEDLQRHLVNSGLADANALRRITSAETTLAAIAESNQGIVGLLREITVESIYQIGHRGDQFQVHEGLTTPYASPKSFELESLLQDAAAREQDWARVDEVVPDLATAVKFRRDLGEREEVTVKVNDWKVLSEIGAGASVREIAERLGTTDFWTARVAAGLLKSDLIVITDRSVTGAGFDHEPQDRENDERPEWEAPIGYRSGDEHRVTEDRVLDDDEYTPSESRYEVETTASADGPTDYEDVMVTEQVEDSDDGPDFDSDGSWWREPEDEVGEKAEGPSETADVEAEDEQVEEDTEAFLEKVFSELESSDLESSDLESSALESSQPDPEPEDEGHGLLRRRRMGSLRDFSTDS